MAAFVTLAIAAGLFGMTFGAYIKISFAIRREDRARSLHFDAPDASARTARTLVGINGSQWG